MLKRSLLVLTCMALGSAKAAGRTGGYDQLVKALQQGDDIRAIVHIEKCTPKNAAAAKYGSAYAAETNFPFTLFSHYVLNESPARYTVATSNSVMLEHHLLGLVQAYGRLRIFENNQAELHTAYFDPKTYEKKISMDFDCTVSTKNADQAIVLIDKNN